MYWDTGEVMTSCSVKSIFCQHRVRSWFRIW